MEKLKLGDIAPIFNLLNQQNSDVNIKSYRGKSIFLYFFLKPLTIRCAQHAREISEIKNKMNNTNLVILGICPDLPKKTIKFFQEENLNFDLLSDPDNIIAKRYGAWGPGKGNEKEQMSVIRSVYIIGSNGRIKNIFENIGEFSSLELMPSLAL